MTRTVHNCSKSSSYKNAGPYTQLVLSDSIIPVCDKSISVGIYDQIEAARQDITKSICIYINHTYSYIIDNVPNFTGTDTWLVMHSIIACHDYYIEE